MSDHRDRGVDVATVRERIESRADVDGSEDVLTAIEDRAEDGRLAPDAFAAWHRDCRKERESTAADLEAAESRVSECLDALDPADRENNQVRARVAEFEDQFESLRDGLDAAAERLDEAPREPTSPVAVYGGAERLLGCEQVIHRVAHGLHHVEEAIDGFESWLHDPAARIDAFDGELRGFEEYLDNTERLLDRIETGADGELSPFDWWLAAHHLQQVMGAVFEELRTDVDELAAWLDRRDGAYDDDLATLRGRLAALEERHATCSDRLDDAADVIDDFEAKREAVADSVDQFEAAVTDLEPPVDWDEVDRLLREQFEELGIRVE